MTAQLIDGVALSQQLRAQFAAQAQQLKDRGVTPGLAVILVGEDPASQVYVRNKVKACQDAGLPSVLEKYEATLSEAECPFSAMILGGCNRPQVGICECGEKTNQVCKNS